MALTSNIVVDLSAGTIVLTCTASGVPVELLTYTNSTRTVSFYKRDPATITGTEFIAFGNQVNIFQTAILFNFAPSISDTTPFSQMIVNEFHDTDAATWSLTVTPLEGSNVCEYTANLSGTNVDLIDRNPSVIIEFPEWLVFLAALNHYRLAVRNFLGL